MSDLGTVGLILLNAVANGEFTFGRRWRRAGLRMMWNGEPVDADCEGKLEDLFEDGYIAIEDGYIEDGDAKMSPVVLTDAGLSAAALRLGGGG